MDEQLSDTWAIHNRINLYLLDAISLVALNAVSATKGRTVAEQFAHMHNVRLMWLKQSAPELLPNLQKVEKANAADPPYLRSSLQSSGTAIDSLLRRSILSGGKVKGFRPHAIGFLGYLISHESHHRGQIALTLKQAGHPLDKKVAYGIWEWGVR